jgi:hypothetical protein
VNELMQSTCAILAVKLVSVPVITVMISMAARKFGPSFGGLILGLPITAAPVLFFLAHEQGNGYGSLAANGILMGLISLSISCLAYSKLSFRTRWKVSLAGCCATFFVVGGVLSVLFVPLPISFVLVVTTLLLVWKFFPARTTKSICQLRQFRKWEIPARMVAVTGVVLLITEGTTLLGSYLSGLLTPFPAYASVLGVFIHKCDGADACALFLRGVVLGCLTVSVFCFLIASFIVQVGLLLTMALALSAAVGVESLLIYSFG